MYPVLFQIWWIEFYSNAVILFIWMVVSVLFLVNRLKKNSLSVNFLNDYFYILVFSFLFFWRLWEIFLKSSIYFSNPVKILYFWDWNFSFFLWVLWLWIVFYALTFLKKEDSLKWMDSFILPFLLWILFISFSNFLSWENYWKPTSTFLWMSFDSPEVRYTLPIHPVQIYEFFSVLIIFFITFLISRKKRFSWVVASFWFSLFFLVEFMIEFLRAWADKMIFWYKFHQVLFLVLAFIFLIFFIFRSHKNINIYQIKK